MRGVRGDRSGAQNRENSPKSLCSRLGSTEDVEVSISRSSKVGRAVYVEVEIERTA